MSKSYISYKMINQNYFDRWNLLALLSFSSSNILHKLFPVNMHTDARGDYFFVERYFPGLYAGTE